MSIFETLNHEAAAHHLSFLVIGGHAVNAYGYARETADVDILINKNDAPAWRTILESLGYALFHDGGNFLQFSSSRDRAWPLDLMLVNEATFSRMKAETKLLEYCNIMIPIPAIEHLLALKIHALKNTHFGRFLKDFQDVVGLIECGKLDPNSDTIKQLFEKYGSLDLYQKVLHALS